MFSYKINRFVGEADDACKLVEVLWAKSLDKIVFFDKDDEEIDSYNGFIMYPYWRSEVKTKEYIRRMFKEEAKSCQFVRE